MDGVPRVGVIPPPTSISLEWRDVEQGMRMAELGQRLQGGPSHPFLGGALLHSVYVWGGSPTGHFCLFHSDFPYSDSQDQVSQAQLLISK
jgi:hypothetical protein